MCARERTGYFPSLLQLCWVHFYGAGAAQQPLCQTAKTQVGNELKSRDQHLGGAQSGQDFPLRKRAAKDAVSKDPSCLVSFRALLAATAQLSSVLLESEQHWQERRSSIIPLWQQEAAAELCSHADTHPCHQPGAIAAGSCSLGNETVLDGSRGLFIATGMGTAEFCKVTNFIGPPVGLQPQGRFVPVCTAQPWPVLGLRAGLGSGGSPRGRPSPPSWRKEPQVLTLVPGTAQGSCAQEGMKV